MSAKEFHEKLVEIGYPNAKHLEPISLEWLTEDPALSPFFEWFIKEVDSSNVLTQQEVIMYEKLVASGATLLDIDDLDIEDETSVLQEEDSDFDLKKKVDSLKDELKNQKIEFDMLSALHERLNGKVALKSASVGDMKDLEEASDTEFKQTLAKCHHINNEMNGVFDDLRNVLIAIQAISKEAANTSHNSRFLSFLPLEDLNSCHLEYSLMLQELSSVLGLDLDWMNKDKSLERSLSFNQLQFDNEVKRLHECLIKVYKEWTSELIQEKCLTAEVQAAETFLQTLQDGKSAPLRWTRGKISSNMSAALDVKASALHIVDVVIPKLVHDIGDLEMGMAVIGSYDIELKRQNEQMSKLDKIINFLVQQLSLLEFLNGAVRQENKIFADINKLVVHRYDALRYQACGGKDRQIGMQRLVSCFADLEKTQSGCEMFVNLIERNFIPVEKDNSYIGLSGLERVLSALNQMLEISKSKIENTMSGYELECQKLAKIHKTLTNLQETIWMECSTKWGPPLLTPKTVQGKLEELETKIKDATLSLMTITSSYQQKLTILKTNPELQKQRGLYLEFCKRVED